MTVVKADQDGIVRGAAIDGPYRWWLTRRWGESGAWVHFLMLNPSTADGDVDDATIRRVMRFGRDWGFVGAVVTNLFAYRATNPEMLVAAHRQHGEAFVVGSRCDNYIGRAADMSAYTVCAWGSSHFAQPRARQVLSRLRRAGRDLRALRTGKSGSPHHPLYLPASSVASAYSGSP